MTARAETNGGTSRRSVCAATAIACAYIYFLIFAQFAFVKLVQNSAPGQGRVRVVMACMGIAGIAASLYAGRLFREEAEKQRMGLMAGFAGCGLAAFVTLRAPGLAGQAVAAAMIGGFLGMLTVNLAAGLRFFFAARHRGLWAGLATGVAYAVCNIPAVFSGTVRDQTLLAGAVCVAGVIASSFLTIGEPSGRPSAQNAKDLKDEKDLKDWAFPCVVAIFLALVWLDSAAFSILQATPWLNQFGWGSAALQRENAGIHLTVAVLAGFLLDCGYLLPVLLAAFAALVSAALCVSTHTPAAVMTHWLYAAGVSLYSTALVFAPTAHPGTGPARAAMKAGILYAVAGWAGSALGVGMAENLHRIPVWFAGLAGMVVLGCSGTLAGFAQIRMREAASLAAVGFLGLMIVKAPRVRGIAPGNADAAAGREVYISEGCLNCHTQFVRPGTTDELWWGPAANPETILKQAPPLIGNRRQGPDLMNIGDRRSPMWNRIHLIDPRALSPDSRMPSYAYLFTPGDGRGEALVAYLASLGEGSANWRTDMCRNWRPAFETNPIARSAQAALFQRSCAQCHGATGRGDGPLATSVGPVPPRNLTLGQWHFFARDSASPTVDLARTIKFGVAGTSMPGHEVFSDSEVLGLAQYVQSLKISTNPQAATP